MLQNCMDNPEKCELLTENGVQYEKSNGYIERESTKNTILLW